MTEPTWGVVATVREHPDLLLPFVCHHLALGAAQVILFLDDPGDAGPDGLPGVEVIRCDEAHWARLGCDARPALQTVRQNTNFRWAVARAEVAWLVHLDADEFLWARDGMAEELARAGRADWLSLPPLERVAPTPGDMFSGGFRAPVPGAVEAIYGAEARFLAPVGMAGHSAGKPMVPARTPWHTVTHKVMDGQGGVRPHAAPAAARILHFEGLTPVHWALKQLRYALFGGRAPVRLARLLALAEIVEAPDPIAAALARFERTYRLDADTLAALAARGALWHPSLALAPALERFGVAGEVDLSGAEMDRALTPVLERVGAQVRAARSDLLAGIGSRLAKG